MAPALSRDLQFWANVAGPDVPVPEGRIAGLTSCWMTGQALLPVPTPVSPWMRSARFWLNHQGGALQMPREYIPRTTENSTGMGPFRCYTASSHASVVLDGRYLLGRRTVPYELPGVMSSTAATLSLFQTVPIQSFQVRHSQSFFHALMEDSIGSSSHELQSLPFPVNQLSAAAGVSSPLSHRLRFRVHSDHTLSMRSECRSGTANRFPTDNLLDQERTCSQLMLL